MEIRGIIFDADGTLLDSMGAWDRVPKLYLERRGVKPVEGLTDILFALKMYDTCKAIKELHGLRESVEQIIEDINSLMKEFYSAEVEPKKGAIELLDLAKSSGCRIVIGTTTDRECIEAALKRLNLTNHIERIFTCSEVGHPKSEPHLFYEALSFMGTKPEETLLAEDGLFSLKTGREVGLKLAGIFDETSLKDQEEIKGMVDCYIDKEESLMKLPEVFTLCSAD